MCNKQGDTTINEEKVMHIVDVIFERSNNETFYKMSVKSALQTAQWKDEQYKEREEGLRETINALDAKLQKANESEMYYFNKCNLLIDAACKWLAENDSYAIPTNVQVDRLTHLSGVVQPTAYIISPKRTT